MSLRLHTAPTLKPVTLSAIQEHLRIDAGVEESLIDALIDAATASAEHIMGRAIMPQKWQLMTNSFDDLLLKMPTVTAVDSVKYVNTSGTLTTLDPSVYQTVLGSDYEASVQLAYGQSWPEIRDQAESVQVIFSCGYADAASVPAPIVAWIKLCVGALFANRELETDRQTYSLGIADRMLDRYKVYAI
ncbi:head-tail connector protein [Undibacterium baiyunense]|uniref:Phage gp6-like head-tail connector protein n=1 Tax=Undibacterium baiyunense TaxID=2828731 RepID=A0A941I416_9BURK|nr:phage head-tail connector protein [Undibacterium baiyunense]MBR7747455.1 hypothetical protein [Undibacterium baiyunense]